MKQVTMALNHHELRVLGDGLVLLLREKPTRPDAWNRQLLELCLRWRGLSNRPVGIWTSVDIYQAQWTIPYLRKALTDASETSTLRLKVKELDARVEALTKPKPKPKPQRPRKLSAKVLPYATPPTLPAPVAAGTAAAVRAVRARA